MDKRGRFTYILGVDWEYQDYIRLWNPPNPKRVTSRAMLLGMRYNVDLVILPKGKKEHEDFAYEMMRLEQKSKAIGGDISLTIMTGAWWTLKEPNSPALQSMLDAAKRPEYGSSAWFRQRNEEAEKEETRWFMSILNLCFALVLFVIGLIALGGVEMGHELVKAALKWIGGYLAVSLGIVILSWIAGRS